MSFELKHRLGLTDEDERKRQWGVSSPTAFGGATTAAPANPFASQLQAPSNSFAGKGPDAYQGGAGWVNLQRYLGVNQDKGQEMAQGMAQGVAKQSQDVGKQIFGLQADHEKSTQETGPGRAPKFGSLAAMPGYGQVAANAAQSDQQAKNLTTFAGRQDLLRQGNVGGNYTAGMGRWDSFLSGAAGHDTLNATAKQYGGLLDRLGLANDQSAVVGLNSQLQAPPTTAAATPLPPPPMPGYYYDDPGQYFQDQTLAAGRPETEEEKKKRLALAAAVANREHYTD